jgi:hypothetical protein
LSVYCSIACFRVIIEFTGSNLHRKIDRMILIRLKGSFTIITVPPLVAQVPFAKRGVSLFRSISVPFSIKTITENTTFFSHNRPSLAC